MGLGASTPCLLKGKLPSRGLPCWVGVERASDPSFQSSSGDVPRTWACGCEQKEVSGPKVRPHAANRPPGRVLRFSSYCVLPHCSFGPLNSPRPHGCKVDEQGLLPECPRVSCWEHSASLAPKASSVSRGGVALTGARSSSSCLRAPGYSWKGWHVPSSPNQPGHLAPPGSVPCAPYPPHSLPCGGSSELRATELPQVYLLGTRTSPGLPVPSPVPHTASSLGSASPSLLCESPEELKQALPLNCPGGILKLLVKVLGGEWQGKL